MKKIIILSVLSVIAVLLISAILVWQSFCCQRPEIAVNNFEECAEQGYPIMESYPRQCKMPDGKIFTEDIGNGLEKIDLIRVAKPRPNELIASPLLIKGEARGFWFFEASFPIKLLDGNGNKIGINPAYIMTQEEWMTEDFVPFEAEIEFENPATKKGTLILEKDNPSGLPENANELRIPVTFY